MNNPQPPSGSDLRVAAEELRQREPFVTEDVRGALERTRMLLDGVAPMADLFAAGKVDPLAMMRALGT